MRLFINLSEIFEKFLVVKSVIGAGNLTVY